MSKFTQRFLFLFLLVASISAAVIYTTVDINTLQNLTRFHPGSLLLALLAVGLGMFFDGSRLMHLVKISNEEITLYQAVQVIFGNYFLALLTPGATGGAVAQVMFLRHAGVPTGKAAVLVIVRTLLSIFFLALCMPFIFLHDEGIQAQPLSALCSSSLACGAAISTMSLFTLRVACRIGSGISSFRSTAIQRVLSRSSSVRRARCSSSLLSRG